MDARARPHIRLPLFLTGTRTQLLTDRPHAHPVHPLVQRRCGPHRVFEARQGPGPLPRGGRARGRGGQPRQGQQQPDHGASRARPWRALVPGTPSARRKVGAASSGLTQAFGSRVCVRRGHGAAVRRPRHPGCAVHGDRGVPGGDRAGRRRRARVCRGRAGRGRQGSLRSTARVPSVGGGL